MISLDKLNKIREEKKKELELRKNINTPTKEKHIKIRKY